MSIKFHWLPVVGHHRLNDSSSSRYSAHIPAAMLSVQFTKYLCELQIQKIQSKYASQNTKLNSEYSNWN